MADTKQSRDEQAHNAERRRREHDLEVALENLRAIRDRRAAHEEERTEMDLASDE